MTIIEKNINHIKEIVAMQSVFSGNSSVIEKLSLEGLERAFSFGFTTKKMAMVLVCTVPLCMQKSLGGHLQFKVRELAKEKNLF
jgi:hypothetical protein